MSKNESENKGIELKQVASLGEASHYFEAHITVQANDIGYGAFKFSAEELGWKVSMFEHDDVDNIAGMWFMSYKTTQADVMVEQMNTALTYLVNCRLVVLRAKIEDAVWDTKCGDFLKWSGQIITCEKLQKLAAQKGKTMAMKNAMSQNAEGAKEAVQMARQSVSVQSVHRKVILTVNFSANDTWMKADATARDLHGADYDYFYWADQHEVIEEGDMAVVNVSGQLKIVRIKAVKTASAKATKFAINVFNQKKYQYMERRAQQQEDLRMRIIQREEYLTRMKRLRKLAEKDELLKELLKDFESLGDTQ